LKGLAQRLDYIRGLGATALWITPPVANQWSNPSNDYFGYHGYWAENLLQVDRHLGSLADYQALSDRLHRQGMYLVQDIVVNHMGNYFTYRDRWNAADVSQGWEAHDQTRPVPRPTQPPFNLNDPRDASQRRAGVYHWTPDIRDYNDKNQEHNFQMSGLDDLNTENPAVRRALRHSYGHWIKNVGVDAFRVDTAFYVPPEYFADFMRAADVRAPGMAEVARRTGRRQFHVFGEGFGIDRPGQDTQATKIERYVRGPRGAPLMGGMLNFPLYGALGDVFARGRPTAELADRITRMMKLHSQPHLMPTFVDNHDVDRFLAGGSEAGLQQALLALFTLPGIPVIYYGTEQGFTEQRASMFAAGWGSGGRDRYDITAPLYRAIAQMAALRKAHPVLSRGVPTLRKANAAQPGALAWTMAPAAGRKAQQARGTQALVVFNTAATETLLDKLDTGLPAGTRLQGALGLHGIPPDLVVGPAGRITRVLAPRSGQVWTLARAPAQTRPSTGSAPLPSAAQAPALTMTPMLSAQVSADFDASGLAPGLGSLQLVVDGDLATARTVPVAVDGSWSARVDTTAMVDPAVPHTVVAWHAPSGTASDSQRFQVMRQWQLSADVADPAGDDTGPSGSYEYPTDPSFGAARQMDLRRVQVSTSGGALRLDLHMNRVTQVWNPANGFDHVAFTVFIELPGQTGGATVMPLQDGSLPEGMRWHRRLRAHGWSNALFSDEGASTSHEGSVVPVAATVQTDADTHRVRFTLPAAALGRLGSLSGAKVWVTTWDYDGGYRNLAPQAQPYGMGGAPVGSPKVMDSSAVIVLP
jgi:glycosidase